VRQITMKDVAERAGVSVTTVSLVLSGKAVGIPEDTRERVVDAAAALDYRPNALASSLRRQTSDTIGFLSDVIATTPHAGAMVQGAQDAAWKAGKLLVILNTEGDPEVETRAIEALLGRQVDGLVYAVMYHQVVTVPAAAREVPLVLLDARSDDDSLSSVAPDEEGGAYAATTHLIENGHRRIGFLENIDPIPAAIERLRGYRAALTAHGIAYEPGLVRSAFSEDVGGYAAARHLLEDPNPPTALFCFNDRMAVGAARAARDLGFAIPGDLSLVGFDNQELVAPLIDPPLTTVQLPHYEMGRWAVENLLRQMDHPGPTPVEQYRMPCPIVVRQSVAAPNERGPGNQPGSYPEEEE
jgi:LacI family transcriptional regulator